MIKLFWKRLVCVFRDHELLALVRWSPEETCFTVTCRRCGKEVYHTHLPALKGAKKEHLH